MINTRLFEAKEYTLKIYNGKAVIDRAFHFYTLVDCGVEDYEEIDYDFPGYESAYFRVYNERSGRLLLNLAMTNSGSRLILNATATEMTFEDNGNYYYEIGYVRDGYEQALRYGILTVL